MIIDHAEEDGDDNNDGKCFDTYCPNVPYTSRCGKCVNQYPPHLSPHQNAQTKQKDNKEMVGCSYHYILKSTPLTKTKYPNPPAKSMPK